MNITPEQLLMKIGLLVMENDALRAELGGVQQKQAELEKELARFKEDDGKKEK